MHGDPRSRIAAIALSAAASVPAAAPALGQTAAGAPPAADAPAISNGSVPRQTGAGAPPPAPSPAAPPGIWQRATLFGDMGGARSALGRYGITFASTETAEILANATGGLHTGADYDGLTVASLSLDTGTAFGWSGGTFDVSALQLNGRNLSTDNLFTLQTASGIEASRSTRLWEAWFRQAFLGGKIDIKLGQQSVDQEFLLSAGSSLFINTIMGWPALPSFDLYAGGPVYPLSSLGLRLRAQLSDAVTVLAGVFDDNPPGGPFLDDSQVRGAEQSGTRFNTGTGALFLMECQYARNPPPGAGLPGVYKLGAYVDTGDYPDDRLDTDGGLLADPASNGRPRMLRGNFGVYGVVDQSIWQPDPKAARALGAFARVMGGPGEQNLLDFSLNAGLTLKSPAAGRDNDTLGLAYGLAHISGAASAFDRDRNEFEGSALPVRSSESLIELTYQAQIVPWWIVQPDLQYVFTPGGGIANPLAPGKRIGNEFVLGTRTVITF